jgi:ABC-type transporter Mla subunit MlaD
MKSTTRSHYAIVLAVIACSMILVAAMTFALTGFRWSKPGRAVKIVFPDATGIKLHTPVRYAGVIAGSVIRIRYLTSEERLKSANSRDSVEVTVQLDKEVPAILADVAATLASENILGEKFISLSAGTVGVAPLSEEAVIQGQGMIPFDSLARSTHDAAENVNKILTKLNSDYPDLVLRLQTLLSQGSSLLGQGSNLIQHADSAVTNADQVLARLNTDYPELEARLNSLLIQGNGLETNADSTITQLNGLAARADGLIVSNQDNVAQILSDLHVVSQNLKVVSTDTKALTATLGERPSRLIWGIHKNKLPSEQEILKSSEPIPLPQAK